MSDRKYILFKSIKCVVAAVEALFAESAITEFQTLASTSRLEDSDQTKKLGNYGMTVISIVIGVLAC